MTTLIAWAGVDSRGPASVYLASDSRISWPGQGTWDNGRKLFASFTQPDIIGFSGQAFLPTQALSQIIELIDRRVSFDHDTPPTDRRDLIVEALERSATTYPLPDDKDFDILYCTRLGQGTSASFCMFQIRFEKGCAIDRGIVDLPNTSMVMATLGSGCSAFEKSLGTWQSSDAGGTSRSVFSALADSLTLGGDPQSGGAPQLVGLYRKDAGKTFGVVWEGSRYFGGMKLGKIRGEAPVTWHNDLFEICDPGTLRLANGAQPQPRPRNI